MDEDPADQDPDATPGSEDSGVEPAPSDDTDTGTDTPRGPRIVTGSLTQPVRPVLPADLGAVLDTVTDTAQDEDRAESEPTPAGGGSTDGDTADGNGDSGTGTSDTANSGSGGSSSSAKSDAAADSEETAEPEQDDVLAGLVDGVSGGSESLRPAVASLTAPTRNEFDVAAAELSESVPSVVGRPLQARSQPDVAQQSVPSVLAPVTNLLDAQMADTRAVSSRPASVDLPDVAQSASPIVAPLPATVLDQAVVSQQPARAVGAPERGRAESSNGLLDPLPVSNLEPEVADLSGAATGLVPSVGNLLDAEAVALTGRGPAPSSSMVGTPASVVDVVAESAPPLATSFLDSVASGLADVAPVEVRPLGPSAFVETGPPEGVPARAEARAASVLPFTNPLDAVTATLMGGLPTVPAAQPAVTPGPLPAQAPQPAVAPGPLPEFAPPVAQAPVASPGLSGLAPGRGPVGSVLDVEAAGLTANPPPAVAAPVAAGLPDGVPPGLAPQVLGVVPNMLDATARAFSPPAAGMLDATARAFPPPAAGMLDSLAPGRDSALSMLDMAAARLGTPPGLVPGAAAVPAVPPPIAAGVPGPLVANPFDAAAAGLLAQGPTGPDARAAGPSMPIDAPAAGFTNLLEATQFGLESEPLEQRPQVVMAAAIDKLISSLARLPRVSPLELVADGESPITALEKLNALLEQTRQALAEVLAEVERAVGNAPPTPVPGPTPPAPTPPVQSSSNLAARAGTTERERQYGQEERYGEGR